MGVLETGESWSEPIKNHESEEQRKIWNPAIAFFGSLRSGSPYSGTTSAGITKNGQRGPRWTLQIRPLMDGSKPAITVATRDQD